MKVLLYSIIAVFLLLSNSSAQEANTAQFSIEWMENFCAETDVKRGGGIFTQIFDFITGEPDKRLVKPFNIVKIDDESYFILDQGLFTPLLVSSDGFEFINNNTYNHFPSLVGVCKFVDNKILFTDSKLSKVFVYDFDHSELDTFSVSIVLNQPTGIVYDFTSEQLYISETSEHKISVLDNNGKLLKTFGGRGEDKGKFNYPTFLAVDENGYLYIVDSMNFRLQIFDKDGNYFNSFGKVGDATGNFNRPKGVAVDSYGHIFIVDALYHSVQVFDINGNFLYNFGGLGQQKSRFWLPTGIFIDREDNVYIADSYNSRIQIYKLTNDN